ncbi:MAG: hypothetical protein H0U74_23805, partial [Bradymonadaceae bacterium]|nr:hypothetical protein [Lujinxingiaceae bacterium]
LDEAQVYPTTRHAIFERVRDLRIDANIGRIFIHLDRHTAPGRFWVYGPRVVPITNYFQTALVLYGDQILPFDAVIRVAAGMIQHDGYGIVELANSFQDLIRRRHLDRHTLERLATDVTQAPDSNAVPPQFMDRLVARVRALSPRTDDTPASRTWTGPPDFIDVLRSDRRLHDAVKEQRKLPGGLFS